MFKDFEELLSAFNAHKVRYLIVGGYAVSFHAQPRATKDLDIFIDPAEDNVGRHLYRQSWMSDIGRHQEPGHCDGRSSVGATGFLRR